MGLHKCLPFRAEPEWRPSDSGADEVSGPFFRLLAKKITPASRAVCEIPATNVGIVRQSCGKGRPFRGRLFVRQVLKRETRTPNDAGVTGTILHRRKRIASCLRKGSA